MATSERSTSVPLSWIIIFVALALIAGILALQFVGVENLLNPAP